MYLEKFKLTTNVIILLSINHCFWTSLTSHWHFNLVLCPVICVVISSQHRPILETVHMLWDIQSAISVDKRLKESSFRNRMLNNPKQKAPTDPKGKKIKYLITEGWNCNWFIISEDLSKSCKIQAHSSNLKKQIHKIVYPKCRVAKDPERSNLLNTSQ